MVNWEQLWDMASYGASLLKLVLVGLLFCHFAKPYLQERKRACWVGAAYFATMLALKICAYDIGSTAAYAIGAVAVFAAMYAVDRRHWEQKAFLSFSFYLLSQITSGLTILPWNFLYDLAIMRPTMARRPLLQFILYLGMELLHIMMDCLALSMLAGVIQKAYHYEGENLSKGELLLMLAPYFSIFTGQWIFYFFSDVYEKDLNQYIWRSHDEYFWFRAAYLLVSFGAILTTVLSYRKVKDGQKREQADAVLYRQMEDMERHIGQVEELYLQIRGLKHDMRNHVMVLESLYEGNQEAEKYLDGLKKQVEETASDIKSGSPVTDVILREKQKEAKEKGIAFQHRFCCPGNGQVTAFDISIILNNALSNAMEAAIACSQPYIILSSYLEKNAYLITVRNSAVGRRPLDEGSGLPRTTKEGAGHGFGLANIRRVAQKYYGDVDIEQNGEEFVLRVMLMIG